MSPVERTLKLLRDEGATVGIVERYVPTRPHPRKFDLFGVADLEALFPDRTLYVQVCRDTDLTDHLRTCLHAPGLEKLLACRTREFEIWSWAKKGNRWRERRYVAQWTMRGVVFVEASAISRETAMGVQTSAAEVKR